jgi:SAM-dependent methyltransferase
VTDNDEKAEYVNGVRYRYRTAWINSLEPEFHWRLYWRQMKIMEKLVLPGQHVLEIGVGTGFTANYFRSKGVEVTTMDIDAEKKPDIVANVVSFEFKQVYDHILAFEVFEHIPFDIFAPLIKKLSRVCKNQLFLSVPRNEMVLMRGTLKLPGLREFAFAIRVPGIRSMSAYHFWEVDHPATPREKFEQTLENAGFSIVHCEKFFSYLYYVLRPSL